MSNKVIVLGGLNTDIVARGIQKIVGPGEYAKGTEVTFGPGGKSRNIAQMIANLSEHKCVAMIGKTTKDTMGLWKYPVASLKEAGVDVDHVSYSYDTNKLPALALIAVDVSGANQIYVVPGVADDLSVDDVDNAKNLFGEVSLNNGLLVTTFEVPLLTLKYTLEKAHEYSIKTLLDPGGIVSQEDFMKLRHSTIYLLKPNEQEAYIISGVKVTDFESAEKAAKIIKRKYVKIENIFITAGVNGAYLFTENRQHHITIPRLPNNNEVRDETGCGDQTIAGISVALINGHDLLSACSLGVRLGTMQFHRKGINPISRGEVKF